MRIFHNDPVWPRVLISARTGPPREIDICAIVGERAFARLPARVRARFGPHRSAQGSTVYHGVMQEVGANWLGRIMARLTRLIGSPVVARTGREVPCTVTLLPDPVLGGTVWRRSYVFPNGETTVATTKRLGDDGRPVESFNRWFGMCLDICEQGGELHFITQHFFAEWRSLRLYLPRWLSPGRLLVVHRDEGEGRFRFIMTLTHPLFGVLLRQGGVFQDPEKPS